MLPMSAGAQNPEFNPFRTFTFESDMSPLFSRPQFNSDGTLLVFKAGYEQVVLDTGTGLCMSRIGGEEDRAVQLFFLTDGGIGILFRDKDGGSRLEIRHKDRPPQIITAGKTPMRAVALSPDGLLLAASLEDKTGTVVLIDTASGKVIRKLATQEFGYSDIQFSPDGRFLATAGKGGEILLWDPKTGKRLRSVINEAYRGGLPFIRFTPDGDTVAVVFSNKNQTADSLGFYETETGKLLWSWDGFGEQCHSLAVLPDSSGVLARLGELEMIIPFPGAHRVKQILYFGPDKYSSGYAVSPDGKICVSFPDGTLLIFNPYEITKE